MATATARIPVLVTNAQKERIAKMAQASGLTMGEFLRRAADSYNPREDDELLEGLINQVLKTTEKASLAIDDALAFVAASQERIEKIEADARKPA